MTGAAHRHLVAAARANPAPLSTWEDDFLRDMERRAVEPSERQMETLQRIAERRSVDDLADDLAERIEDLAVTLRGEPSQRKGDTWRWGTHGSLAVVVTGPRRGRFADYEAGVDGGPIDFICYCRNETVERAIGWATAWLGGSPRVSVEHRPSPAPTPEAARPVDTFGLARRLWREAMSAEGTPAEVYLATRGLHLEPGLPLRFHAACPRGWVEEARRHVEILPAMLALMTDPATGEPVGVHRTFLRPDGSGKAEGQAKMMCGRAGVIRLSPDAEVTTALGIAEGVETALSLLQAFDWRPVWAAASAGAIARFPVLDGIEALTIFADRDRPRFHGVEGHTGPDLPEGAGLYAAGECAARWLDAGREARIQPPAGDWNDAIRSVA